MLVVFDFCKPILIMGNSQTFFKVILIESLKFAAIGMEEDPQAISFSIFPLPFIDILQQLKLNFVLEPKVLAIAIRLIVTPLSHIFFMNVDPVHGAKPVFFILLPVSFILVLTFVNHLSCPMLQIFMEFSFERGFSIAICDFTLALLQPF